MQATLPTNRIRMREVISHCDWARCRHEMRTFPEAVLSCVADPTLRRQFRYYALTATAPPAQGDEGLTLE